jgi:outer membrane protein assembly factor BamB
MRRAFLFLLIFSSLIFSSQVWDFKTNGEIYSKPVIYSNNVLIASTDGSVNLLNSLSGSTIWKQELSGTPIQPVEFQNQIMVPMAEGKVFLLAANGAPVWEADLTAENVTKVIGADVSSNMIYVSTDRGLFSIDPSASIKQIYKSESLNSPPTYAANSIFVGEGLNLLKLSSTGSLQWKRDINGIWMSKPVVDGSIVYVGGLDKKMHALLLGNGVERWSFETGNWVVASPLIKGGYVYFGSNDGAVYALDESDGRIKWVSQTPLAIQSTPTSGFIGGKEAIFLGGTDNSIYAFDINNGDIIWRGSVQGWVSDPVYHSNFVYFGSADRSAYAFSTERACSIISPDGGDIIGFKEVKVTGNAVSEAGSFDVDVQVNDGEWNEAEINADTWAYYFDPKENMVTGVNTIRCRVSDPAGVEIGFYPEVGVIHDSSIKLANLLVTTKGAKVEGESFEIFVNDGEDGSPVERFDLTLNGQKYSGSGSVNITVPSGGSYQLVVKKIGFNDANLKVDVASIGINPIFIGIAVLLVLIIVWQVYVRFVQKKT